MLWGGEGESDRLIYGFIWVHHQLKKLLLSAGFTSMSETKNKDRHKWKEDWVDVLLYFTCFELIICGLTMKKLRLFLSFLAFSSFCSPFLDGQ